jgi:ribonuclease G
LRERDKFQSVVLKVSEFGLVQMTRKRSGKTLLQQLMNNCGVCRGTGVIKSTQTEVFNILRDLRASIKADASCKKFTLGLHPDIFDYITNKEYNTILEIERVAKVKITLITNKQLAHHEYTIDKK